MPTNTDMSSGRSYTYIDLAVTLPPADKRYHGWEAWYIFDGDTEYFRAIPAGNVQGMDGETIISSKQRVRIPTPMNTTGVTIFGVTVGSDANGRPKLNTIVPGVTPSCYMTIGGGGTIHGGAIHMDTLGPALRSDGNTLSLVVAPHMDLTSGVLGVAPGGITADLVAQYAINNTHIERVGINKLAVVDSDIVNLAVNKLLAGTATFYGDVTFQKSGYPGYVAINSSGVGINQGAVSLVSGNTAVILNATYVSAWGQYAGLTVANGSTNYISGVTANGLYSSGAGLGLAQFGVYSGGGNWSVTSASYGSSRAVICDWDGSGNPRIRVTGYNSNNVAIDFDGSNNPEVSLSNGSHTIKLGFDSSGVPNLWIDGTAKF